ncbi:MAG TPA: hypothetical protein VMA09_23430 [Candidatus Binataceae bacterium]|nr:hypothetical protein [Candidatus Binataceae bacterium]
MSDQPVAVAVGVDAGLGAALARRFAEKYRVALVARDANKLRGFEDEIRQKGGEAISVPAAPQLKKQDMLDPAAIAETFWHLAHQDRSAWTQDIDVRPFKERF